MSDGQVHLSSGHPSGGDSFGGSLLSSFRTGPQKPGHRKKLWEVYPSRSVWYLDGRCVSGPDRAWFYISLSMILVPSGFWYGFSMGYLVHHISVAIAVISACAVITSLVSLFIAGFSDPGILPRRPLAPLPKAPESLVYMIQEKRVSSKYCMLGTNLSSDLFIFVYSFIFSWV